MPVASVAGLIAGVVAAALSVPQCAQAAQTLRVYHVGNSVTDTINYDGLTALAASRGSTNLWARHMIPGAPLAWIWNHPADGFQQSPYGYYPNALPNYTWDAITLQPFDRQKGTVSDPVPTTPGTTASENDIPVIRGYIQQALQNSANANTQFYVYSRWPRKNNDGTLPYTQLWDRTYTGGWDGTNESRDYFQRVVDDLNSISLGLNKPILMVPVGDVLYELDKRMEQGLVPGYGDIIDIYADGIHFNSAGSYVVGLTFYATLYKDNPNGMPVPSQWGTSITAAQAAVFQDTVWDVVAGHPYSGVPVPEPTAIAMILGGAGLLLARRRSSMPTGSDAAGVLSQHI